MPLSRKRLLIAALDTVALAALKKECRDAGEALFAQYVSYFREDLTQAESDFAAVTVESEPDTLYRLAHGLRGASAHFGARPLMELCARAEKEIQDERFPEAVALIPELLQEIRRVQQALPGQNS